MISLYPHQREVVEDTRHQLSRHDRVLIRAATGFGKTVLAAYMAKSAISKGKRVWFVCHRRELITQTSKTFDKFNIEHGYIGGKMRTNHRAMAQVCSIRSLANMYTFHESPDLVIWDEAHHMGARSWHTLMNAIPAKHIGLSATPQRLDGKGLGDFFDVMVEGRGERWLIDNGFLSEYRIFAPTTVDRSQFKRRYGDFTVSSMMGELTKPQIVGDVVKNWMKYGQDQRTILFAASVEHSERLSERFRAKGVMAVHVDGKTKDKDREAACKGLAAGTIDILSNVELFGEGFDIAAQADTDVNIGTVIQARPTESLCMHRQQIGRALRRKPYRGVIIDCVGNSKHGLPDDEIQWSLNGGVKLDRSDGSGDSLTIRQCPRCYAVHRTSPKCPECFYVYPAKQRLIDEVEGELCEFADSEKQRKADQKKLYQLIGIAKKRGYKNPEAWAAKQWTSMKSRGG